MAKSPYPLLDLVADYPKLVTNPRTLAKMGKKDRIQQGFAWARERHSIYLKRHFYQLPAPWSDIPVMASTRWCNVYRALDKVSKFFIREVYRPNLDNPNLWFAAMICRYINHPDSISDLMDANQLGLQGSWNWEKAAAVLDKRKKAGLQFVTGAYLVNSVSSSHFPPHIVGSKPHVICYRLNAAWQRRKELSGEFKDTMERGYNAFSSVSGFGPFLSYQALVDLSYFNKWLGKSPDLNSFNAAGPGTKRGVQRIFLGRNRSNFEAISQEFATECLLETLECARSQEFWPQTDVKNPGNGWAPLSLSDLSSFMCENDKLSRLILDEGKTRSRYEPALTGEQMGLEFLMGTGLL
jgi:hypothetical protein